VYVICKYSCILYDIDCNYYYFFCPKTMRIAVVGQMSWWNMLIGLILYSISVTCMKKNSNRKVIFLRVQKAVEKQD
jgi:hypothetical protein